jgi:hypothetical protein
MSSVGTEVLSFSATAPDTFCSSLRMLSRPTAAKSCRIVVSGGQNERASAMSSNPTMLMSPGMSRPSSCSARITPSAIWSLAAKMAVTSARPTRARPCEVRDRAQVFVNRQGVGVLARDHHDTSLALPPAARGRLEILVEDQGRVDYGRRIGEDKGLIGPVRVDGAELRGWDVRPMPLEDITAVGEALRNRPELRQPEAGPAALTGQLPGPAFAAATN